MRSIEKENDQIFLSRYLDVKFFEKRFHLRTFDQFALHSEFLLAERNAQTNEIECRSDGMSSILFNLFSCLHFYSTGLIALHFFLNTKLFRYE